MLANFYLREFDKAFINYCDNNGIVYIRWADDIVLFGHSPKQLEQALHRASRLLLSIGLNFSAAKTRLFSRNEFREYRALDLLDAIQAKNSKKFLRELRKFEQRHSKNGGRIDTVVKASLNMLTSEPGSATLYSKNYILESSKEYSILSSMNEGQLLKKYNISGNHLYEIKADVDRILAKPYAAPRAAYLSFLVKHQSKLNGFGINQKNIRMLVQKIAKHSGESDIVEGICVPSALSKII